MGRVQELFASHRLQIDTLIDVDSDFKEICRDYDQLAKLLDCQVADELAHHIRDSLEGLELEIKEHLARERHYGRLQGRQLTKTNVKAEETS